MLLAAGCMHEVLVLGLILIYHIKVLFYVVLIYMSIPMNPGVLFSKNLQL